MSINRFHKIKLAGTYILTAKVLKLSYFVQVITIDELLNMMAVFIEIGEGKDHKVSPFFY